MRIIAGRYRSRRLEAPAGRSTRPSSDRLRETLFNVLAARMEGARFLDLYAGSGAVGLEALSRGAAEVEFVERGQAALAVLRKNLAGLGVTEGFRIHGAGVGAVLRKMGGRLGAGVGDETRGSEESRFPTHSQKTRMDGARKIAFDVVFLDPPYDAAAEYAATLGLLGGDAAGLLAEGAVVIAEHRRKEKLEARYGVLERTRLLEQGDAGLSFYGLKRG